MQNPENFKSGYVAVAGRPNVGKSTLVNLLLGQKVAAVSPRPQTTRKRQLGILTRPDAQIIFIDTPGLHKPVHKLGEVMNSQAFEALTDADVILFLVDASMTPAAEDYLAAERLTGMGEAVLAKTLLVVNKMDLITPAQVADRLLAYQNLLPMTPLYPIAAIVNSNCDLLLGVVLERLPFGPVYFPEEQVTDMYEREISAELIRAAALINLRDEVPHGIAVRVEQYTERGDSGAYIVATLFVERESHKAIVIGQAGKMIKEIGATARQEIESMSGRKVFLDLHVKVRANWRDDQTALRQFGFDPEKEK